MLNGMCVPVVEKPLARDIDRVNKYNMLRGFTHFVQMSGAAAGGRVGPAAGVAYTHENLIKDLDPYIKYYDEFNLKNEALDYIERQIEKQDCQASLPQLLRTLTPKLRNELQDELTQVELFREDFYTVQMWLKDQKRPIP
jgi:hypothetical protein